MRYTCKFFFDIRVVCIQALVEACSGRSTKDQDRRYESKNQNISGHCIYASLIEQTLPLHENTYFACKPGKSKCVATTLLVSEAAMAKSRQSICSIGVLSQEPAPKTYVRIADFSSPRRIFSTSDVGAPIPSAIVTMLLSRISLSGII